MKNFKTLRRRGLALFVALMMCLGMLPTTAFAAEEPDHQHNVDGWVCLEDFSEELSCANEEHEHDESCWTSVATWECSYHEKIAAFLDAMKSVPAPDSVTEDSGDAIEAARAAYDDLEEADKAEDQVSSILPLLTAAEDALKALTDDSSANVTDGEDDSTDNSEDDSKDGSTDDSEGNSEDDSTDGSGDDSMGGSEDDFMDDSEDDSTDIPEEIPDAVKAFLDAVASLPEEITDENREDVEAQMQEILAMFVNLTDDEQEREDVTAAQAKLAGIQAMLTSDEPESWGNKPEIATPWLQNQLDTESTVILPYDLTISKEAGEPTVGDWRDGVGALVIRGNVTLDLNGHTLTWAAPATRNGYSSNGQGSPLDNERNLFTIENGATLTIKDSQNPGGADNDTVPGASIKAAHDSNPNNIFCVENGGTLKIESGVYNGSGGRGAWVVGGGTLNMSGGTIVECKATSEFGGGAVFVSGTFNMSGGTISWSKADTTGVGEDKGNGVDSSYKRGGGVYVAAGGTFNLSGGVVRNCDAKDPERGQGGGVYVAENGKLAMFGGGITNNGAVEGSGVYSAGEFSMSGGDITNHNYVRDESGKKVFDCTAGGGVYLAGGTFTKTGGGITANNAAQGGGVYVANGTFTTSNEGTVIGNEAELGGGVYVAGGTVTIGRSGFHNNYASQDGGGMYIAQNQSVKINDTRDSIWGNKASRNGGGIYIAQNATVEMSAAMSVHQNQAVLGGGVYNAGTFKVTANKSKIYKNYAVNAGDDIYSTGTLNLVAPNNDWLDNGDTVDKKVDPSADDTKIWTKWCPDYGEKDNHDPKCPNHHVTDWYDDSDGSRWDAHDMDNNGFHAETYDPATATTPVALKAAHPPCTYEVEYYLDGVKVEASQVGENVPINSKTTSNPEGWIKEGWLKFVVGDIATLEELSPRTAILTFPRTADDNYVYTETKIGNEAVEVSYDVRYDNATQGVTIIKVYYLKDVVGDPDEPEKKGDGIPDVYQAKVTFKSEGGQLGPFKKKDPTGEFKAIDLFAKQTKFEELIVYVTLYANGKMDENGEATLTGDSVLLRPEGKDTVEWVLAQMEAKDTGAVIPTVGNHPNAYHSKPGTWDNDPKDAEITKEGRTFTYTYDPQSAEIRVNYIDEDHLDATPLKPKYTSAEYKVGGSYDVTSQVTGADSSIENYVRTRYEIVDANGKRVGLKVDNVIDVVNFTVNVYYSKDANGDTIPDKYQVPVNYKVVNGSWNSKEGYDVSKDEILTTCVTLYKQNEEGKQVYAQPGEDGAVGHLTETQIPAATPIEGYGNETWAAGKPTIETKITVEVTYTVAYSPRTDLSYTVKYLKQGTNTELHPEKAVNGQTFGASVTEQAITIEGYNVDGDSEKSITIAESGNEIIFYYTAKKPEVKPDPEPDPEPETHTLTVHYVYANGATARPDYSGDYAEGARYSVDSPAITGYTASQTVVSGRMGSSDLEVTVVYTANPTVPTYPSNPGTTPSRPSTPSTPTTTIPSNPTPLDPGTTIADEEVPLAHATGLNDTDHFAYVIGYDDDTVKPLNDISRAEVATIFFRLMTEDFRVANWATTNSFTDVKEGDWYNIAISTCANAGILKGYEDGTFQPNRKISRAEFAAIAARFMDDSIVDDGRGDFSDTADHWAAADIRRAAKAGWISGEGNKFRPTDNIKRAEVMTIVNRMLDRTPDKDHMLPEMKKWTDNPEDAWYYEAVQEATNEHDYDRDKMSVESWTLIKEPLDWAALELGWSQNNGASTPAPVEAPVEGAADETLSWQLPDGI